MSHLDVPIELKITLAIVIVLYVMAMYALGLFAQKDIDNEEDYVVAGRRLPLPLAWATLLGTWFGAGTLLTCSTEVAKDGIRKAAIDPLGAGLCLIIAGMFYARPLWRMSLLTLSDFYKRKFGDRAEVMSAFLMIPSYFGWVAAQFVALANLLTLFFGLPLEYGIFLVALVGTGYTLLGGMWSVTLTDAFQITLVLVGLIILTANVLIGIGGGDMFAGYFQVVGDLQRDSPEKLVWVPTETMGKMFGWLSILCAGALGNLPGQDLMQRVFSSKSETVAQQACYLAGVAYLAFGMLPILLGLVAASQFKDEIADSVLPALAHSFMHPAMAIIFVVVLMSAVLSSIDSAILSPATVLAQNILSRLQIKRFSKLTLNRFCVLAIAICSLLTAYSGEGAFRLLENSYSLTMVGLFVPLTMGLVLKKAGELSALASMIVGVVLWLPQYLIGWEYFLQGIPFFAKIELSLSLTSTSLAFIAFIVVEQLYYRSRPEVAV